MDSLPPSSSPLPRRNQLPHEVPKLALDDVVDEFAIGALLPCEAGEGFLAGGVAVSHDV